MAIQIVYMAIFFLTTLFSASHAFYIEREFPIANLTMVELDAPIESRGSSYLSRKVFRCDIVFPEELDECIPGYWNSASYDEWSSTISFNRNEVTLGQFRGKYFSDKFKSMIKFKMYFQSFGRTVATISSGRK